MKGRALHWPKKREFSLELKIFSRQFLGVSQCLVQVMDMDLNDGSSPPDSPQVPLGGCSYGQAIAWRVVAPAE